MRITLRFTSRKLLRRDELSEKFLRDARLFRLGECIDKPELKSPLLLCVLPGLRAHQEYPELQAQLGWMYLAVRHCD